MGTNRYWYELPVGWGGTLEYWQYNRERKAAAGVTALVPRQWSPPPPDFAENNNMTIRRIFVQRSTRFHGANLRTGYE